MARFIVIERGTGRVYGDTARFGPAGDVVSPADAVCLFDRHLGRAARGFGYVKPDSDAASYDVYEIPRSRPDSPTASDLALQLHSLSEMGLSSGSLVGAPPG
ncbi:hypothetical protein [Methylobacterium soli]|uniref:hypothetical protein n=2 Tax=Methylobacterium soli TaxID=553447 RepID=UPI00177A8328|nr:hypothetical protein [Methylobacterium soli]